jgi:hypothetical protein
MGVPGPTRLIVSLFSRMVLSAALTAAVFLAASIDFPSSDPALSKDDVRQQPGLARVKPVLSLSDWLI